jgi:hypothetical protein
MTTAGVKKAESDGTETAPDGLMTYAQKSRWKGRFRQSESRRQEHRGEFIWG